MLMSSWINSYLIVLFSGGKITKPILSPTTCPTPKCNNFSHNSLPSPHPP